MNSQTHVVEAARYVNWFVQTQAINKTSANIYSIPVPSIGLNGFLDIRENLISSQGFVMLLEFDKHWYKRLFSFSLWLVTTVSKECF